MVLALAARPPRAATTGPLRPAAAGATAASRLPFAAGNRAVAQTVAQRASATTGQPVVQRHSSWEHAMMGDANPAEIGKAIGDKPKSKHLAIEEAQRVDFFRNDVGLDPRERFPDIRWIQLSGSQLWVSYGEMNALADYLPDADAIDRETRKKLVPVLQRMRASVSEACWGFVGLHGSHFVGAAWSSVSAVTAAGGEVKALDGATGHLGTQRYQGLLARNACHFAPFSWNRWSLFHNQSIAEAAQHHAAAGGATTSGGLTSAAPEHERQAWLQNGYGDHFLQDSFASGHLVNKTLTMQLFLEYLQTLNWAERPWFGTLSAEDQAALSTTQQPGLAGRSLYTSGLTTATASEDRISGSGVTDPQTGVERLSRRRRRSGTGVQGAAPVDRDVAYQRVLRMLNNAFTQNAAGEAHNLYNGLGLQVENGVGDRMWIGGDDTYLTNSGAVGAERAAEASHWSQEAVRTTLETGTPNRSKEEIFGLVPIRVVTTSGLAVPIEQWNDGELRQVLFNQVFPDWEDSWTGAGMRTAADTLVDGGVSPDAEAE